MNEDHQKIDQLLARLQVLTQRQEAFSKEIDLIKHELNKLKAKTDYPVNTPPVVESQPFSIPVPATKVKTTFREEPKVKIPRTKSSSGGLEKYIGENLFSKLGIAIIVIGVGIGAKFAIDNDLVSPVVRVILGYLVGFGLLGFAVKLKSAYHAYSAVLMSGAMAIFYFMTYVSHDFYGFLPSILAFGMMVAVTGMTVMAAIYYKEQVIAIIGQVGAYAVPFFLSDGSDDMQTFFTYMAIINVGILFVAFKQYWKGMYFSAFILTWLFFSAWCFLGYDFQDEFVMAFSFNTIFFILFYLTFLAYKLVRQEKYQVMDVFLLLINSFIFFGLGYFMWEEHPTNGKYLGLFAILNGVLHLMVGILIYLNEKADRNILLLVAGLVILFFTLAVPIQLDGSWVTLIWMGEAVLLFSIGRIRKTPIYEKIAYPLLLLAFLSLMEDWNASYSASLSAAYSSFTPLLNIGFYTSFLCAVGYGAVQWVNSQKKYPSAFSGDSIWLLAAQYMIPTLLLITSYNTFGQEISQYWNYKIKALDTANDGVLQSYDYNNFAIAWRLIYSLAFLSILALLNYNFFKSKGLAQVNVALNTLIVLVFLGLGLSTLGELWESYFLAAAYSKGTVYLWIRYLSIFALAAVVYTTYSYFKKAFIDEKWQPMLTIAFHITLLWLLSSEWLTWGATLGLGASYKLGLSILWGSYSLLLIVLGIWKNKAYLRIAAIGLFGLTLLKLFFYDIAHLGTLPKTVVFIALGILLLIISFLYNKYRQALFGEELETSEEVEL